MDHFWDSLGNFARWLSLGLAMLTGLFLLVSAINAARGGDLLGLKAGFAILLAMGIVLAAAWIALRGGSLNYLRVVWLLLVGFCFLINNLSRVAAASWVQASLLIVLLGLATSLAARKKVIAKAI